MTKAGTINTQPVSMGISLLGGNAGVEGPYELGIAGRRSMSMENTDCELFDERFAQGGA
jgi:hypothetical protein